MGQAPKSETKSSQKFDAVAVHINPLPEAHPFKHSLCFQTCASALWGVQLPIMVDDKDLAESDLRSWRAQLTQGEVAAGSVIPVPQEVLTQMDKVPDCCCLDAVHVTDPFSYSQLEMTAIWRSLSVRPEICSSWEGEGTPFKSRGDGKLWQLN